jgi:hypothetical protein
MVIVPKDEPRCLLCNKGLLIPVSLGKANERYVVYRCTNPRCNARFDEHGYELYNSERQEWDKLAQG